MKSGYPWSGPLPSDEIMGMVWYGMVYIVPNQSNHDIIKIHIVFSFRWARYTTECRGLWDDLTICEKCKRSASPEKYKPTHQIYNTNGFGVLGN